MERSTPVTVLPRIGADANWMGFNICAPLPLGEGLGVRALSLQADCPMLTADLVFFVPLCLRVS